MKKFLMIIGVFVLLFSFFGQASALDWHVANQATVAWDKVTTAADGTTLPATAVVKYQTYLVDAINDPTKANPIDTGIVDTNQKTFTLTVEGQYYVGAKSLRYENNVLVGESPQIAWSDIATFCKDGITFGFQFFLVPANIENFYPQ